MDLAEMTIENAKPLEGTTFDVELPDGRTVSLKLDAALTYEVSSRRPTRRAPTAKRAPFALYFLGPAEEIVPQGMYRFRSESMTFDQLFIVPIGQDDKATEYEAVFT